MLRRFLFVVLAAFSILVVACSGTTEIEPADSYDSLAAALEAAGMNIDERSENGILFASMFSVPGIEVIASGQQVLAFEFANAEEAAEQVDLISDDGYGIGLRYINWRDDPQVFLNGNMLVIYDGTQSLVTDTLISAMGVQILGANAAVISDEA